MAEMAYRIKGNITQKESLTYENLANEKNNSEKYEVYNKWAYSGEYVYFNAFGHQDCVLPSSDVAHDSFDLLSTLIINNDLRKKLELDEYYPIPLIKYTPDYLADMEKRITKYLDGYFFAYFSCNLGNDIDIVGGIFSKNDISNEEKCDYKTNPCSQNEIGLIITKNKISKIDLGDDIYGEFRIFNQTLTGADVLPCIPKLLDDKKTIEWSCFDAPCYDEYGITEESRGTTWRIDLNGKVISKDIDECSTTEKKL